MIRRLIGRLAARHLARREAEYEQMIRLLESQRNRESELGKEVEDWLRGQ